MQSTNAGIFFPLTTPAGQDMGFIPGGLQVGGGFLPVVLDLLPPDHANQNTWDTLTVDPLTAPGTIRLSASGHPADVNLDLRTQGAGDLFFNGVPIAGGGGLVFPITSPGDMGFRPDGVANNALLIQNQALASFGLGVKGTGSGAVLSSGANLFFEPNGVANDALVVSNIGGAINGLQVTGQPSGTAPTLTAFGGDTNIDVGIAGQGNGKITLTSNGKVLSWNTGTLTVGSSGTNTVQGANGLNLDAGSNNGTVAIRGLSSTVLLTLTSVASAVNAITLTNAITGNSPALTASGSDASIDLVLRAKGAGGRVVLGSATTTNFTATIVASGVNYLDVTGAVTTANPILQAKGSDTNVNLSVRGQGTGRILLNVNSGGGTHLGGHLGSSQLVGAPTVAVGAQASAAAFAANSTDLAGLLNVTTVAGPVAGALAVVTFRTAYVNAPVVLLCVNGTDYLAVQPSAVSTAGFTVSAVSQPAGAKAYSISYWVLENIATGTDP